MPPASSAAAVPRINQHVKVETAASAAAASAADNANRLPLPPPPAHAREKKRFLYRSESEERRRWSTPMDWSVRKERGKMMVVTAMTIALPMDGWIDGENHEGGDFFFKEE